jgi:hypothetical protein
MPNLRVLHVSLTRTNNDGDLIAGTLEDDQSHGIVFGLGESPISWNYGRLIKKQTPVSRSSTKAG